MVVIQISVAIAVLAFVVLVIYLARTLRSTRILLDDVRRTMAQLEPRVDSISLEVQEFIKTNHEISRDIKQKLTSVNSLFETISQVSDSCHSAVVACKHKLNKKYCEICEGSKEPLNEKYHLKLLEFVELLGLSLNLWQKFNRRS
jgi:uncharacterized protein YoxC